MWYDLCRRIWIDTNELRQQQQQQQQQQQKILFFDHRYCNETRFHLLLKLWNFCWFVPISCVTKIIYKQAYFLPTVICKGIYPSKLT